MAETPTTDAPTPVEHNIRVVNLITGEHVICNFGQIREEIDGEQKFVAYQLLYPLALTLSEGEDGSFNVTYRRWNPYTPYEDHRINPTSVISAMPPAGDILKNYVAKLQEANIEAYRRVRPEEQPSRQILLVPRTDIDRLESLLKKDSEQNVRQIGAVNVDGESVSFTG